jgi:hypothetical protein
MIRSFIFKGALLNILHARTLILLVIISFSNSVFSQIAPARTWTELKEAITERVNAQRYPLTGFDPKEVTQILTNISSLDRDEWAKSWMNSGNRLFLEAKASEYYIIIF